MEIEETTVGGVLVLAVSGRIDTETAPALHARLAERVASDPRDVLLDFCDVIYVSSSGLRVLMMTAKALRVQQRRLVIAAVHEIVFQVFEINGFATLLSFAPTRAAGLAMLGEPAG